MVKLHLENGQVEEHPDLLSIVKAHPEIEEVCLICRCISYESSIDRSGIQFNYEYEEIDWEYSCVGSVEESAEGLEHFAANYSVWDCESIGIREGILYGQTTLFNDSPDNYKESVMPPCTMEKGWMVSADRVVLTSITLPSGKTIRMTKG